ncbi:MAG: hypothetical protein SOH99_14165 [Acidipropionibacterium acidipropionici]|jgi:hypothetical protein|uniref:DUF1877 family protein n=1 Tax=Acidipropionibacterium acidipropionici TaxID=1748 RepID=A0AAC9APA9_9ACTN|nr:hypothetical protein [Acidipropionibacterium acidipropionici]AMS06627.1 hypothetical protein AXH35_15455 [Acidipropionibacterium acidipropionici]AOZ45413.1 hypothetical protein A8L58_00390 [Acidipropionibacterium acidipropionici]AZP38578.1 hypothetical protein DUY81_12910 [Acidipropionibacterium acidipropionici]
MGIRYYAYPVTADRIAAASIDPATAIPYDPFATSFMPRLENATNPNPLDDPYDDLYLDKVWSWVGHLFATDWCEPDRPAYELFKGNATTVDVGWIPWEQFISPQELRVIAADLDSAGPEDVDALIESKKYHFTEREGEWILDLLRQTQQFVRRRVERGEGMAIHIG